MAQTHRGRNAAIVAVLVVIAIILLLLTRCNPAKVQNLPTGGASKAPATAAPAKGDAPPARPQAEEVLTPATLAFPGAVGAGAEVVVEWTGPHNPGDLIVIAKPDAAASATGNYKDTKDGPRLTLTAPIEPGPYEVRYVTAKSRTILAHAALEVLSAGATLEAPGEVVLGSKFEVWWQGPNNKGDFITIVPQGAKDDAYASYVETDKGGTVTLTAPPEVMEAEVRYVTGQGRKVLGRRTIRVMATETSISAPAEAVAGSTVEVAWTGPNNTGDYITVVPAATPDGEYGNYTNTSKGSPLKLLMPIMTGDAQLRYMSGQGRKVLARRAMTITAAEVTLSAPAECGPAAEVSITWTGPSNPGDYITIVKKGTPDGQYAAYTNTTKGSPLTVKAPKEPGDAEIRYCAGQGNKVLARVSIVVKP
jgi:hypothetical protein